MFVQSSFALCVVMVGVATTPSVFIVVDTETGWALEEVAVAAGIAVVPAIAEVVSGT